MMSEEIDNIDLTMDQRKKLEWIFYDLRGQFIQSSVFGYQVFPDKIIITKQDGSIIEVENWQEIDPKWSPTIVDFYLTEPQKDARVCDII